MEPEYLIIKEELLSRGYVELHKGKTNLGTDLRTCSEDQLFSLLISCILAEKLNIDSQ